MNKMIIFEKIYIMIEEKRKEIKSAILLQSHILYHKNNCDNDVEDDTQVGLYTDEINDLVNEIVEIIEDETVEVDPSLVIKSEPILKKQTFL